VAPSGMHIERFLPPFPLRMVVNTSCDNVSEQFSFAVFKKNLENLSGSWLRENREITEIMLPEMVNVSLELAETSARKVIASAITKIESAMGTEIRRLKELQKINPEIRNEEFESMEYEEQALISHVRRARFRLDALRVVLMN
jgi:ATP-dependent helicase HepA